MPLAAESSVSHEPASPASGRIRVCYLISHFHPVASGAERQALAQGIELVRRGHEVHVLTRTEAGEPSDASLSGVQVHRWIRTWNLGPLFGASFVLSVIRALRKLRPRYDLIHTHQGLWEAIATGLGRNLLGGAPVLVQPASAGYYGEAQELARTKGFPILRRLALRNRHFAAISDEIEREWRALGVGPEHLVRMASGVDAEHFRPGPSKFASSLPQGLKVIFTGRIHPQKNLEVLLEIWPEVAARTGACLILVGDGPERNRLERQVAEQGLTGRVRFVGRCEDPAEYLRAADLFVLPSVAEGMSNSLLEAMASALPCVASAIGGNSDLIDPGRTGYLVAPTDAAAWARVLISLLEDPEQRRYLGAAARARIEADYALPVVVDRYLGLYQKLLNEPRSAGGNPALAP